MQSHIEDNRRIARNTLYLYLRLIVALFVGLYTGRAILDALGVEDMGIYNVVGGVVSMLSIFTASITSAAQRFITYAIGKKDEANLKNTFSTFATLYIIVAIAIYLLGGSLSVVLVEHLIDIPHERISAAYWVYHLSLLSFVISMMAIPYTASVIAYEKMNFYALISIGESLFRLVIVYLLYTTKDDRLIVYSLFLCGVSIIVSFINAQYCKHHFPETRSLFHIDHAIFNEMFSYSAWVTIGTSSAILKDQGINILINRFFGVAMNAARGISMTFFSIVNQFSVSIGNSITPQITKSFASGDINRSVSLTFVLAKTQGLLIVFLSLPAILEIDFVLGIWLVEVPYYAATFSKWVLILCLARTLGGSVVPLLLANGKVKYLQIVSGSIMLLNIPFSYIALCLGAEPVSTMIIGTIIEICALISGSLFLKYYVNFPVFQFWIKSILPVIFIALLASIIPSFIRYRLMSEGFLRFFVVGAISCIMVAVLTYLIALNNSERKTVIAYVKNKLH